MLRNSFLLIAALATMQAVGVEITSEDIPVQHELLLAQGGRNWGNYQGHRREKYKEGIRKDNRSWNKYLERIEKKPLQFDPEAEIGSYPLQYFNYPEYIEKTADEKLEELWSAIMADTTPEPFYWVDWGTFFKTDMRHAF